MGEVEATPLLFLQEGVVFLKLGFEAGHPAIQHTRWYNL